MVTCTTIPVSIPKDGPLPKTTIKEIISTFLPTEWPYVDPESLTVIYTTGYANTNCIVSRPIPGNTAHSEPLKVFFKIHGPLDRELEVLKHLVPTKQEESQLCYEYGQSGLGAKVYGFFQLPDGTFGRVDEFLDAHPLQPENVENEDIRAEVARAHAVFHAMEMTQLRKNPIREYFDAVTPQLGRYHKMEKLKRLAKEGGLNLDQLIDYDLVSRLQEVVDRLDAIGAKGGWCIHDVQLRNVMVKNRPRPDESKVVLIDFEFVFQNYRAFDIGGHFVQKMFQWFDEESHIASCRPYTDEEKRHFCEEYAKQWNKTTGDEDTGEQVFMEAELGIMLAISFEIHNMLCFMDQDDDNDPLNLLALNKLFGEFVSQYEKLGLGTEFDRTKSA
ncbi:putative choline kinase [Aspergillus ibericus CBS 121593]|uniref:Choline/ethanolamine kinase n=1 Tax=Aspergillus ibericus CBS 121593 TaxID=1448316 RepID=A0A395H6K3_9EURO|nr:choline/ethanolamine kinase [Aspergillus ibericus CBS 121593]RAL02498.1 choline/ethanolamine kinase [Aspergillus ibericus CBS 121593]